jgi:hypothetical protein
MDVTNVANVEDGAMKRGRPVRYAQGSAARANIQ